MYISIDIETTGLDPEIDQILQVAAVSPLGNWNVFVEHQRYVGNAYALSLNSWILEILSKGQDYRIIKAQNLLFHFTNWIKATGLSEQRLFALGKNFAGFDRQFLKAHDPGFDKLFHYRSLDVGSLYADRNGIASLKEIVDADIERFVGLDLHKANHDAMAAYLSAQVKLDLPDPATTWLP